MVTSKKVTIKKNLENSSNFWHRLFYSNFFSWQEKKSWEKSHRIVQPTESHRDYDLQYAFQCGTNFRQIWRYHSKRDYQRQFPNCSNLPNVQFLKLQLPKSVLAAAFLPLAHPSCSTWPLYSQLVSTMCTFKFSSGMGVRFFRTTVAISLIVPFTKEKCMLLFWEIYY